MLFQSIERKIGLKVSCKILLLGMSKSAGTSAADRRWPGGSNLCLILTKKSGAQPKRLPVFERTIMLRSCYYGTVNTNSLYGINVYRVDTSPTT